ncbi:SusC/RagA family TonB-linked outer membrane protein [Xanthocytophaga flava]|uniref:SusC/RagA family TonB-linked outer membrane protein n=1 Tax=Xanthocytophaga flava TaxID=3048013 RepID=UPI0028D11059|nr:SusC/RagA family TonB-linked outer membrane protein [Xanthocytophaga flavus]MDJ1472133.1 SusC/RagA family TonB-linked outer membrane protein [Xanthocytophaga flavus]
MKNYLHNTFDLPKRCVRFTLFCVFSLLAFSSYAQTRIITGKVTSVEEASGLPGVSVVVKGTTKGTTTGADGKYSIEVPEGKDILIFSFIGFLPQEVAVGNRAVIDVPMDVDTKALQEVVVTALGIKKDAKTIGYATQEVKGADLIKAREPNPINSLVGKVAGLTVGASAEMLGRPQLVLRGNEDVLFVVDGVPVNSDTWNVSPDDIETYTVLKGPNASALYGFRGKNGAILITTKRGSSDKRGFSIEFNSSTMFDRGFNAIPKTQNMYGPGDHGVYAFGDGKGAGKNDGDYDIWGPALNGQLLPQYDSPITPGKTYTTTFPNGVAFTSDRQPTPFIARGKDNLNRFIQTGILSTNNISISSSNDKYDLRFSVSNSYQKGIVPNTQLNITNFNMANGINFSPKLRLESSINYNRQSTPNIPDVNYGPNSLIYNITIWGGADWNIDDFNPDKGGSYWQPGKEGTSQIYAEYQRYNNPWFVVKEWLRGHYKNDVYGYTSLRYKLSDYLEATLRTQVTTWNVLRTEKMPFSAISYDKTQGFGDYREDRRNLFENNTDVLLKFAKDVLPGLNMTVFAGGSIRTFNYTSTYATTDYLNTPGVYNFSNSRNAVQVYNFNSKMQVIGGYYSLDLSYKGFLNLSTTGRVDKLSTLPSQNNTYFYPSVAASTVISDYVHLPSVVSFLKVRGSYANVKDGGTSSTIGPAGYPIGYGAPYSSSYDGPSYINSPTYTLGKYYNNQPYAVYTDVINNPNLKRASNSSFETGFDIRFLQNRLGLDLTYYTTLNGPQIFPLTISEGTGYLKALVNAIKTRKTGLEISVTGTPIKSTNGFTWDVLANWSTYKEVYKEFHPSLDVLYNYFKVGDRVDKYYDQAFVRTPDGQIINDAGGRPIQTTRNQFLGYSNPDWVWSINNKFNYKGITLSLQFDGRVGGVMVDYVKRQTFRGGRHIATVEGEMGIARANDVQNVKSYVGQGVVVSNGAAINYDSEGKVTNYNELAYAPNTTKTFLQDYISRYYSTAEGNLISKTFGKLREVVVGYTIPSSWLSKTFIRQANVSFVGRNLLYFAKEKDVDIDQYAGNQSSSNLQTPTTRRYGFNLNVVF